MEDHILEEDLKPKRKLWVEVLIAAVIILFICVVIFLMANKVSAVSWYYKTPQPTQVNYSQQNVNNSLYWQGHIGTDGSWLTGISLVNNSYYLASNPSNFYNVTNAPTYLNDTWGGNSTNYYNKTQLYNVTQTYNKTQIDNNISTRYKSGDSPTFGKVTTSGSGTYNGGNYLYNAILSDTTDNTAGYFKVTDNTGGAYNGYTAETYLGTPISGSISFAGMRFFAKDSGGTTLFSTVMADMDNGVAFEVSDSYGNDVYFANTAWAIGVTGDSAFNGNIYSGDGMSAILMMNPLTRVLYGLDGTTKALNFSDGNIEVYNNISVDNLIKLTPITLPACNANTNGSIGRNNTGVYGCNASSLWVRLF